MGSDISLPKMTKLQMVKAIFEADKILAGIQQYMFMDLRNIRQPLQIEVRRLKFLIDEVDLFLHKHTGAITVAAHSANTVLGDVCLCCGRRLSGSSRAATSETGDVGQNLGDGSCEAT